MAKRYPDSLKAAVTRMWRDGWSKKKLAKMVGVYAVTLSYWVDPEFRARRLSNNAASVPLEEKRASNRRYYAKNSENIKRRVADWKRSNKDQVNTAVSMRSKRLREATPPWQTVGQKRQIKELYLEAKKQNLEVDHIHPLNNPSFCGLHVAWNLQLLTPDENKRKGNRLT